MRFICCFVGLVTSCRNCYVPTSNKCFCIRCRHQFQWYHMSVIADNLQFNCNFTSLFGLTIKKQNYPLSVLCRRNPLSPGGSPHKLRAMQKTFQCHVFQIVDAQAAQHPLLKVGTPEEVSALTLFFASDAASNTTGALIPCTGGRAAAVYRGMPAP